MTKQSLSGTNAVPLRIVVAEDEAIIRLDLCEMLAEAGYADGFTLPTISTDFANIGLAGQAIAAQLEEVGITLELNPVEISVWADQISTDGIPVTMLYFAPDHTDSSQYVQYFGLLEGSQWQTWSGADPVAAEGDLLTQALAAGDASARADLYAQLAQAMIDDQIIIPVVNPDLFLASASYITGMHYSACCNLDLAKLGRAA